MRENPYKLDVVSVRLVEDAPLCSGHPIERPEDAVETLGSYLCGLDREVLCAINLRTDGVPISCNFVSMGTLNESMAHPREIFKAAILSNAASIMLVHNHPSGNLIPSKSDTLMTDRLIKNCEIMGIPLVDHIIVGGDNSRYFSFREKNMMESPKIYLESDYRNLDIKPVLIAEDGGAR